MISIFVAPLDAQSNPIVPPQDLQPGDTGYALAYTDAEGLRHGGWSLIGRHPFAPTVLIRVDSTDASIAAMKADSRFLFVEDAPDAPAI